MRPAVRAALRLAQSTASTPCCRGSGLAFGSAVSTALVLPAESWKQQNSQGCSGFSSSPLSAPQLACPLATDDLHSLWHSTSCRDRHLAMESPQRLSGSNQGEEQPSRTSETISRQPRRLSDGGDLSLEISPCSPTQHQSNPATSDSPETPGLPPDKLSERHLTPQSQQDDDSPEASTSSRPVSRVSGVYGQQLFKVTYPQRLAHGGSQPPPLFSPVLLVPTSHPPCSTPALHAHVPDYGSGRATPILCGIAAVAMAVESLQ